MRHVEAHKLAQILQKHTLQVANVSYTGFLTPPEPPRVSLWNMQTTNSSAVNSLSTANATEVEELEEEAIEHPKS